MATEDIPTWEAAILNARYLAEFGSWRFSPNDARGLLGHLKNEEREQLGIKASSEGEWYQKLADRLNYPVVRAAMSILASDAITSGPAAKPYTQKTFGDALQDLGFPPGDRTVKSWVIPLLHHAGLIDGYEIREAHSAKPRQITLSGKGLHVHLKYLQKLKEKALPYDRELCEKRGGARS